MLVQEVLPEFIISLKKSYFIPVLPYEGRDTLYLMGYSKDPGFFHHFFKLSCFNCLYHFMNVQSSIKSYLINNLLQSNILSLLKYCLESFLGKWVKASYLLCVQGRPVQETGIEFSSFIGIDKTILRTQPLNSSVCHIYLFLWNRILQRCTFLRSIRIQLIRIPVELHF